MKQPFEGINVLDFCWAGVGPIAVNYMGFFGATIVKVESHERMDPLRTLAPFKGGAPSPERSFHFAYTQMAPRYSITLNLADPKGIELANRLVAWADVVCESWSTGQMEKMGLDYEHLKEIKPDIIMFRTCMHGHSGPLAAQHGQGYILCALSGLDALTGWPDRSPAGLYGPFTDHVAPLFNAIGILAALDYRRRTGKGICIDQSQHESLLHWIAPLLLNSTVNGRDAQADGNRTPYAAPHGVYRCAGDDRWCAIAVFNDHEWDRFCGVIQDPQLRKDRRFATLQDRKDHEDELDKIVENWTMKQPAEKVMSLMQAAGVPAGVVTNGKDQAADPQLQHYHFFNKLDHPEMGELSFYHGPLFRLSDLPFELERPPIIGEDNDYVYTKLLGIPDDEFVKLMEEGVI
jgi:benzylsuccinate CoA-transferase BbsF subunit